MGNAVLSNVSRTMLATNDGMKTLPIVLGTRWTKVIVVTLVSLAMFMLGTLLLKYIMFSVQPPDYISMTYFIVLLLVPLAVLAILVIRAKDKKGYHRASSLIKLIMLTGILYSIMVFYLTNFRY